MTPSIATFVFEVMNFVTLMGVLGWLFFSPLQRAIEARRKMLSEQMQTAAKCLSEAEAGRADIASQRASLATDLAEMRSASMEGARKEAEGILINARQEAERERRARLGEETALMQAQAARLAVAVVHAAHQVVLHLLARINGPDLDDALLRSACRELRSLGEDRIANSVGPVTVESAHDLSAEARVELGRVLGVSPQYRVLDELVAGIRILGARGLIDASVTGLTAYAEHVLSYEIQTLLRENQAHG